MTSWIDVHTHLGDVCAPWSQKNNKQNYIDAPPDSLLERLGYSDWATKIVGSRHFPASVILDFCGKAASCSNVNQLQKSMSHVGISRSWVLPVAPAVSADSVLLQVQKSPNLLPLLSIDFSSNTQGVAKQIDNGLARHPYFAIKFHPNLQNIDPLSKEAFSLYEAAGEKKLLVMMHAGRTPFLREPQRSRALLKYIHQIPGQFTDTRFLFCHMGGYFDSDREVMRLLKKYDNVWMDTSGVSSGRIAKSLEVVGAERVLFGSDWPYASQEGSLKIVRQAVLLYAHNNRNVDVPTTLDKILKNNAIGLMGHVLVPEGI